MNEIVSTMDSDMPLSDPKAEQGIYARVDNAFKMAVQQGDSSIFLDMGANLICFQKLTGLGLARFYYLAKNNWHLLYNSEELMYEDIYARFGQVKETVDRYSLVWQMIDGDYIPSDYLHGIKSRSMRDLSKIATLVDEHQAYYKKMGNDEWARIAKAATGNELNHIVREIKEKQPHNDTLSIFLKGGRLFLLVGGRYKEFTLQRGSGDIDIERAIDRIVRGAGILEEG